MTHRIPQPPPSWIPKLGNVRDIDPDIPAQSLQRIGVEYGPIFILNMLGNDVVFVTSEELVSEVCDEKKFKKKISGPLKCIRDVAGDGLFTAHGDEPNWAIAHRILLPAFGTVAIRNMFPEMYDIADQLVKKWERFGSSFVIDVPDNMTRLTMDTIALCAFDYRFNSFYQREAHPFVEAMGFVLKEAGSRARRVWKETPLTYRTNQQYHGDITYMHGLADEIIKVRKAHPVGHKDLLSVMLNGRDSVTGQGLSDENIRFQLVTFLIAGHETTSGLLSFCFYQLLKHPDILRKVQQEVDDVIGTSTPTIDHISKLKYIEATLKETLRVHPPVPALTVSPLEDTIIGGGKYKIAKGSSVTVLPALLHRDPKVWGTDAEEFKPERMLPEAFAKLPPHAWKPFGNGERACLGRPFAMQEAILVVALILQKFTVTEHNSQYTLKLKETATIKPDGFYMHATLRRPAAGTVPVTAATPTAVTTPPTHAAASHTTASTQATPATTPTGKPLLVLYGSNSGSSESFAQRVNADAVARGFTSHLDVLDSYAGSLPLNTPTIIITCSYEGQPASNARHFVSWLDTLTAGNTLAGVTYAVFGCGHHDWVSTYQAVPKKIDEKLAASGASRLLPRGETDAAGDFFGAFDAWYDKLWATLSVNASATGQVIAPAQQQSFSVKITKGTRFFLLGQQSLDRGRVVENVPLTKDEATDLGPSKRHIQIALPEGMTYNCGDYLAILPTNPLDYVRRVLALFDLDFDSQMVVETSSYTTLPTNRSVSVQDVLTAYVEIAQVATRKQLEVIAESCTDEADKKKLLLFAGDEYDKEVLKPRRSVLDILEDFKSNKLEFGTYLAMLPAMRVRQYSISSSPLWNPHHVTLTIDVLDSPALSGHGRFKGVGSNYLADTQANDRISVAVRPSATGFGLPTSAETPIIMVCAGTGLAPFRGFIQERAAQKATGRKVGKALLFYGHRDPVHDALYSDELKTWEALGAVQVRHTYSRKPEAEGVLYVQHKIWNDRSDIVELFAQGARIYVCGSATKLARDVKEVFIKIIAEQRKISGEEAAEVFKKIEHARYSTDVFG